jgi:hypothetical protein
MPVTLREASGEFLVLRICGVGVIVKGCAIRQSARALDANLIPGQAQSTIRFAEIFSGDGDDGGSRNTCSNTRLRIAAQVES